MKSLNLDPNNITSCVKNSFINGDIDAENSILS